MLAWLHAAFSHEVEVEKYLDTTEGVVSGLPEGRCWVSEVILKPEKCHVRALLSNILIRPPPPGVSGRLRNTLHPNVR